jgi:class 3 adenylate cyclase
LVVPFQYDRIIDDITSSVHWEVAYNFALMQQMSSTVTSAAFMTGSIFPNLTLPQFEISGGYVDGMGGIMSVAFAPHVKTEKRDEWESYAKLHQQWIAESLRLKQVHPGHRDPLHDTIQDHEHDRRLDEAPEIPPIRHAIWRWDNGTRVTEESLPSQIFAPLWQSSPASAADVNVNLLSDKRVASLYNSMIATRQSVLSNDFPIEDLFDFLFDPDEKLLKTDPHAFLMEPVYADFEENSEIVGFLLGVTTWINLFNRLIPEGANGIVCVVKDSCGGTMAFELNGPKATFMGDEDLHEKAFHEYEVRMPIEQYETKVEGLCAHELFIYPSSKLTEGHLSNTPAIYTTAVALVFLVTAIVIIFYDMLVTKQQEKTMRSAIRSNKLVASLFPENVRDRIMSANAGEDTSGKSNFLNSEDNLKLGEANSNGVYTTRPIADFFSNTTIMFADIAGFTAWASTREPHQVFQLLETIYGAVDKVAKHRGVFKVETVGDCYVAACGVPVARHDHAVVMARFARNCLFKMSELTRTMEVSLGPATADLGFRIGLHSGSVTGGVLRGDNARFQLFGDTMNTAARIETTGAPNRIHLSQATADLLVVAGKGHWVDPRTHTVVAKGKGQLQTFWLRLAAKSVLSSNSTAKSVLSSDDAMDSDKFEALDSAVLKQPRSWGETQVTDEWSLSAKDTRLVEWNVTVLAKRLEEVVEQRGETSSSCIQPKVVSQMKKFVEGIAKRYNGNNPFHNFEHASHVTMAATKILSRVENYDDTDKQVQKVAFNNGYRKDITSDALTQFAVVFSALIHDVDHAGVPNAQLVAEQDPLATKYDNKSVAEMNSIDVACDLLFQPQFSAFSTCLCPNEAEKERFHDLVVHAVLATDIMDPDLKEKRDAQWESVFGLDGKDDRVKASIVMAHLIQTADICHTMQHWQIYQKWNERLFQEMYTAFTQGRSIQNPAETWYKGELGFFDFYIIPLASKLSDCVVFGVSSDEFLNYALDNRKQWELKGQQVVETLVEKYCK